MSEEKQIPSSQLNTSLLKKKVKDYIRKKYKEGDESERIRITPHHRKEEPFYFKEQAGPLSISEDANILAAYITMKRQEVNILQVQDGEGNVTGILLLEDLRETEDALFANMCSVLTRKESKVSMPSGPFHKADGCSCAILLFAPSDPIGEAIDVATGNYGYSHAAIDCCEIDEKTGKRVIIEATEKGVHRSFIDAYGDRPYERIEVASKGIDCEAFCKCIKEKIGQPFDYKEAVSRGKGDDPKKQICSGLIKECFPDSVLKQIEEAVKKGTISKDSVIPRDNGNIFISPNGLAEFFGAPRRKGPIEKFIEKLTSFLCKENKLCYEITIRAENISISNITQTPVAPSPTIGCWTLTDGRIKSETIQKIHNKVNKDFKQTCPVGCGCLILGSIGPLTFPYNEHVVDTVNQTVNWLPDIHCQVTLDVQFDIVIRGKIGACLKR